MSAFQRVSLSVLVAASVLAVGPLGSVDAQAPTAAPGAPPAAAAPGAAPAAGAQAAPAQPQQAGPPSKARCDESTFKFGQVWANEKVVHTFIIHNDGEGVLTLEAKPTCGCTVAEYDKTVPPGGQGKVKTELTVGNYTVSNYNRVINVATNDPNQLNLPLTLSGDVKQKVSAEPPLLAYFGQLGPGVELTKKFKLTNNTETPMKLEVVAPPNPTCFKVSIQELEPGKTAEVTVVAEPPFQEETNAAQFSIQTGIEGVAPLPLPCNLIKPPVVQVLPPSLRLPPSPLASAHRQQITVHNNGEAPVAVKSVEVSDPEIKYEITENLAGKRWTIQVEAPAGFTPNPTRPPVVTVTTDYEPRPAYSIPILSVNPPRPPVQAPTQVLAENLLGKPAPPLAVPTVDGGEIRIGSGTNRVMLVNFWASWCSPSRGQLPMLDQLYRAYRSKGVEFVNISVDEYRPAAEVKAAAAALDSKMPLALDPTHRVAKALGVSDFPMMLLIGKDGTVEAVRRGIGRSPAELEILSETIKEQLDKLLEGKNRSEFTMRPISIGTPCRLQQVPASPAAAANAALAVEAFRQDAGMFKPKSRGEYRVYVRNVGTQPAEIKSIKASEGMEIDENAPKSLAPGETAFINCLFNTPERPQNFAYQLAIESTGANPMLTVLVTGQTKPFIELQPVTGIDFQNRPPTFTVPRIATLIYNGPGSVEYKPPTSSSPRFEAVVEPRPHNIAILTVKAIPPFEPGENHGVISIPTSEAAQPLIQVPVRLHMPRRLEASPASIDVPATRDGHQAQISIVNLGDSPVTILDVNKTRRDIEAEVIAGPDGTQKVQVTFPPDFACGPNGESITLRTSDEEYSQIVVPVRGGVGPGHARPRGTRPIAAPGQVAAQAVPAAPAPAARQ